MTIPFWCLFVACILPYLIAFSGAYFRAKSPEGLDNKNPRQQAARLEGLGARAYAAQQNAWEALPVFTAAVCVSHLAGARPDHAALAAMIFVLARLLHFAFYMANRDALRSASFFLAFGSCMYLFGLAINA